jgi:hypothetical protein
MTTYDFIPNISFLFSCMAMYYVFFFFFLSNLCIYFDVKHFLTIFSVNQKTKQVNRFGLKQKITSIFKHEIQSIRRNTNKNINQFKMRERERKKKKKEKKKEERKKT